MNVIKFLFTVLFVYCLFFFVCAVFSPLVSKEDAPNLHFKDNEAAKCKERIECIDNNKNALLWRLRLINSAKREIILSTFDFSDDNSGNDIISTLYEAAERNIKIKLLIDGLSGYFKLHNCDSFNLLVSHPNVEARFYNPVNPLKPWKINYRMHDKYLISDDVFILGGRNISDLFLGEYSKKQNIDRDILVYKSSDSLNTAICELKEYFYQVWELPCCKNVKSNLKDKHKVRTENKLISHFNRLKKEYPVITEDIDWKKETFEVEDIFLIFNPVSDEKKLPLLWQKLTSLMDKAKIILIQSPYFICNNRMYDSLKNLISKDTKLHLLTNGLKNGANPWGCADYLGQRKKILNSGTKIFENSGFHSIHTKTVLIDKCISIVGSFNFDMRSVFLDTEIMLVINSPELNSSLCEKAVSFIDTDKNKTYTFSEKAVLVIKGLFFNFLRILSKPFRYLL